MHTEKRNPGEGSAGAAHCFDLGRSRDELENTLSPLEIQATRLRRHFAVSKPLAHAICEHAYSGLAAGGSR